MAIVFWAIVFATEMPRKSSFIKTISDASIAASLPTTPIAMPISALIKTGASLIPSPTKHNTSLFFLLFNNFSTSSTLF